MSEFIARVALHGFGTDWRPSEFMVRARDRRGERRAVHLACDVVRGKDYLPVGKRILDLSPHGMQLKADGEPVGIGDPLQVLFKIPFTGAHVFVDANVTRVVRGARPGDSGLAYGVRFHPLAPESDALLKRALKRFPPTLRWRPRRIDFAASVWMIGHT